MRDPQPQPPIISGTAAQAAADAADLAATYGEQAIVAARVSLSLAKLQGDQRAADVAGEVVRLL